MQDGASDGGVFPPGDLFDGNNGAGVGDGLEVGEEGGAAVEGQDVVEEEFVEEGEDFAFVPGDEAALGEGPGACEPM